MRVTTQYHSIYPTFLNLSSIKSLINHINKNLIGEKMKDSKRFSEKEARKIGEAIGIDWDDVDFEQFRMGLEVELEHGKQDPQTDVTNDDPIMTGKIALAHLKEISDYYSRLDKMEKEAE